jgi:hypothetical protein
MPFRRIFFGSGDNENPDDAANRSSGDAETSHSQNLNAPLKIHDKPSGDTPASPDPTVIRLEGPQKFDLSSGNNALALPELTLHIPAGEGPLHDLQLEITVNGAPDPLRNYMGDAYSKAPAFQSKTIRKTTKITPVAVGTWEQQPRFDQRQTIMAEFTLHFRTSERNGAPAQQKQSVSCSVELVPEGALRTTLETTVTPKLLRIHCDQQPGPELRIAVQNLAPDAQSPEKEKPPTCKLSSSNLAKRCEEWKLPGLKWHAELMMTQCLCSLKPDGHGGWSASATPLLKFSDWEIQHLRNLASVGTQLRFDVNISVEGSPEAKLTIELLPEVNSFAGVVSIDHGTSASTIVVNDPSVIDSSPVPFEQVSRLKTELLSLFRKLLDNPHPDVPESQLMEVLRALGTALNLKNVDIRAACEKIIENSHHSQSNTDQLFEFLRQFELAILRLPGAGRRYIHEQLHRIMKLVFDEFPLTTWNMKVVEAREDSVSLPYIASELELSELYPEPEGITGSETAGRHRKWLNSGEDDQVVPPRGSITRGRFVRNPKSALENCHLSSTVERFVTLKDKKEVPLSPQQITFAAFSSLLKTFGNNRRRMGISPGALNRVVVTYPASLLPEPREQMSETIRQLGIRHVDTTIDEAVAPAIFYIEQRFSDAPEIGPEAFKNRCIRLDDTWYHQMLIIDVGAGTTDIALVQIEMRESPAQIDAANGGRIYVISPRLLGSTGREHLGGNLITLSLFRCLKLQLSRWLEQNFGNTAVTDVSQTRWQPLTDRQASSDNLHLLNNQPLLREALDHAESILPTRFNDELVEDKEPGSKRKSLNFARFHALWETAEILKIEFSRLYNQKHKPNELELESFIRPRLAQILAGTKFEHAQIDESIQFPSFLSETFEKAAKPVIENIKGLADALTAEAIRKTNQRESARRGTPVNLTVDSIVLSGRSCQLPLFRDTIEMLVRQKPQFNPNQTEVLYQEQYAKLATAIGALRAQRLVSLAFSDSSSKELASGQSSRDLDIRNLFFFLPFFFKLGDGEQNTTQTLFEMHDQFRHQDFSNAGCLRSDWHNVPNEEVLIYRVDGEDQGDSKRLWAQLLLTELANKIRISTPELREGLQIRYEVTHELDLYALLRRHQDRTTKPSYFVANDTVPAGLVFHVPPDNWKSLLKDSHEATELPFDIFVGEPRSRDAVPLIAKGTTFDSVCISGSGETARKQPALWSKASLPTIMVHEKIYHIYARDPRTEKVILLAHFDVTKLMQSRNTGFSFEARYRLLVTRDGTLSLFCGDEPPRWSTDDPQEWFRNEGQILRYKLQRKHEADNSWRDPFSGTH